MTLIVIGVYRQPLLNSVVIYWGRYHELNDETTDPGLGLLLQGVISFKIRLYYFHSFTIKTIWTDTSKPNPKLINISISSI